MPSKVRPSITKRNREQARRDRQAEKAAKRSDRAAERLKRAETSGEDPDLAGIVAGPQQVEADSTDRDQGNDPE